MTGDVYRDALGSLGLTLESGAKFLRIDSRTSRRIAQGEDYLQWPRSALLRIMVTYRISVDEVSKLMQDFEGDV